MAMELLTELDAVNTMLASIGERPVNSISGSTRLDVTRAVNALDEISRMVQQRGWWFNTVEELELTPTSGEIVLPTNTLKVKKIHKGFGTFNVKRLVLRKDTSDQKLKLYNITERSFNVGANPVTVDLVEGLDFEEMPETARHYIAIRAALTFQARSVGSQILHAFTEADARDPWVELRREQSEFDAQKGNLNTAPLTRDLFLRR